MPRRFIGSVIAPIGLRSYARAFFTLSDIARGLVLGCKRLKFFSACACGGVAMVEEIPILYRRGGVSVANLKAYLKLDTVAAVSDTWMTMKDDLVTGQRDNIRNASKAVLETGARVRSPR